MKSPTDPDNVEDHNRMMIAFILSVAIMMAYQLFFVKPKVEEVQQEQHKVELAKPENTLKTRGEALAETTRLPIRGAKLTGSVSIKGLRLDDLVLNDQFTGPDRVLHEPLLTPSGAPHAFYAESGWLSDTANVALPAKDTVWTLAPGSPGTMTSDGKPVKLTWNNGQGLVFTREISLDEHYLFTITQSVANATKAPVTLTPYHLTARNGFPRDYRGLYTLHEGPVARLGGKLEDPQYKKLTGGDIIKRDNTVGWLGLTDKYWMAVLLPDPHQTFNARILADVGPDKGRIVTPERTKSGGPITAAPDLVHFQADLVEQALTVQPGQTASDTIHLYAGVKVFDTMKAYEKRFGFDRLEDAIDFGIWFFITKPFYQLFHFILGLVGNVGLGVLAMTVVVRGAMFPLATKSYVSMAKMKRIQPQLKELQEKHKGDQPLMQEKIMALYQKENANPFSGCLPMVVQVPVFFALYKTILIAVELRHAAFPGWIEDLSAPDPTTVFNLFGLIPWTPPDALMIGGWPLLFCLTMIVQKRLTPPMADAVQEKVQSYFPLFITFMMAHFAVGLVIYWTWSNILAVLQQYYIMNKVGGEKVSLLHGHHERRQTKKKKD
jgi:YidC/Oxa1 family membrane protein insertase